MVAVVDSVGVLHGYVSPENSQKKMTLLSHLVAIIIGCSPAFASLIRKHINTSKPSYNAQGYLRQGPDDVKMENRASCLGRPNHVYPDIYWQDTHSSQEELAKSVGRIVVKTTLHQDDEPLSYNIKHNSTSQSWGIEAHDKDGKVSSSTTRH